MQNFSTFLRLIIPIWFLLTMTSQTSAEPGFDLDLKELKKPSTPLPATSKKTVSTTTRQKSIPAKKQASVAKKKKPAPYMQTAAAPPLPVVPSELALKGGNACLLAERMAVAVARSIPAETVLNGLDLKPVAAVIFGNLSALITCGISDAEAYTYSRLLAGHQVQLVNIIGNETAKQVARSIIDALALSYQIEADESSRDGNLIYLIPADHERQRPLRLILQP